MAAGAQVVISSPNFYRLVAIAYSELPLQNTALTQPLYVRNGFYLVSDTPCLGHELNPESIDAGPDQSLVGYLTATPSTP